MIRTILLILAATGSLAQASVTKVGNGDDGADLENLSPIVSGPIVEARAEALRRLRDLNVMGIAGLGMLIHELQNSQMLLASQDAHPTGEEPGAIEISEARNLVYARTFAEPYAATRFFPAALSLTPEQLVALHVHEALHRSLPVYVREDENVVMHITMAITSPGANHDRVRQVASLYMRPESPVTRIEARGPSAPGSLPKASKANFAYQFQNWGQKDFYAQVHGLEFATSLGGFKAIGPITFEPRFRARLKTVVGPFGNGSIMGPSAYDVSTRFVHDDQASTESFVRFTAKSLEQNSSFVRDRDIWSMGIIHRRESPKWYGEGLVLYSLASDLRRNFYSRISYRPIWTITGKLSRKWGAWRLGGLGEIHASEGSKIISEGTNYSDDGQPRDFYYSTRLEPDRMLVLGPEVAFVGKSLSVSLYYKAVAGGGAGGLMMFGDIVDRGAFDSGYGVAIASNF